MERQWRQGSRSLRPFLRKAQVKPRGLSRRLQRLVTDMGADAPFEQAAAKIKEHHGVEVARESLRRCALGHAHRMAQRADDAPACTTLKPQGPDWLIASADGTMAPTVRTENAPPGTDRRKHRKLAWEELRLVAVQTHGQKQTLYDATLGTVEDAGRRWSRLAGQAGWALNTRIHAIGDGAEWIARQAGERFGACHRYTLDLYHVCDYLAAAAPDPANTACFVADQRRALRENRSAQVINRLRPRIEPPDCPDEAAPVRKAVRYLQNRPAQLDYAFAIQHDLPVGSGIIESGHRHVLQARIKRSGSWWNPQNLHAIAQLRVTRSNNLWLSYWNN